MPSHFFSEDFEPSDIEKNSIRILVVDNWSFQLMETLSTLGHVGYFNTFPALSGPDALSALCTTQTPYDVILCSAEMNIAELRILLLAASKHRLAPYFSLIGDKQSIYQRLEFLYEASGPDFRFLGVLTKPLSPPLLASTLSWVDTRARHKTKTLPSSFDGEMS
ncbi:CheY-like chemotaxis protein [Pseudomonas sp. GGS8]|uniref:hypothetical protein n=1 Tax=Pseudomonas sp. GGS8 TaxID=2817892 RepID=UPI0020A0CA11|nr:hypothetical protein [Pseudomonas sp. GGS8]MCP1446042.1 CheY-like chemotaxis protein [Pseudomonas sp. GGS8]